MTTIRGLNSRKHFGPRLLPPGATGAEDWREKRAFPANLFTGDTGSPGAWGHNCNGFKALFLAVAFVLPLLAIAQNVGKSFGTPLAMPNGYGLGACLLPDGKQPAIELILRHSISAPWAGSSSLLSNMTRQNDLSLGRILLPGVTSGGVLTAQTDAVSRIYRIEGDDPDGNMIGANVTVTRLTPAILIELDGTELILFVGARSPCRYALSDGKTVRVGVFEAGRADAGLDPGVSGFVDDLLSETVLDGVEHGWLLLWYGADSWFLAGKTTRQIISPGGDEAPNVAPGDAPLLVLFSQPPIAKPAGEPGGKGGLTFVFDEPGAKVALLPLYPADYKPHAAETEAWSKAKALPEDVAARCAWWAGRLAEYPLSVSETVSYDVGRDELVMRESFSYSRLRPGGVRIAPISPMLELARRHGFPITLSADARDSGMATYCGPYAVVENADGYSVRIAGLGKYVWEKATVNPTAASANTRAAMAMAELAAEIDRVLAAGHMAPVFLPFKQSFGWGQAEIATVRLLYSAPGQTLSSLSAVLPFLDAGRQQHLRAYMARERAEFPPETVAHLPCDAGARREAWTLPESYIRNDIEINKSRGENFHLLNKLAPAQALYDLACYYAVVGPERMRAEGFDLSLAVEKTIAPWLRRADWATLTNYGWPENQRDLQQFGSYGYNQAADANRLIAGLIGMARLARMAGDGECERQAMQGAVRAFTYRFAMGKYTGWLYEMGNVLRAPEGFSPADDAREAAICERYAMLGYSMSAQDPLPRFNIEEGPYMALTQELARFVADFLKPEAESFARMTAKYYPDALLTLGTPHRANEWWHNSPQAARQIFLVYAWILGRDGDWLATRLDAPLVPRGDWHHLDKLTATLAAYGATEWKTME